MNDAPGAPDTPPPGAPVPDAPEVQQAVVPMRFLAQFIKDLSFEAPHAPDIFNALQNNPPEMDIVIDTGVSQLDGTVFEVTMQVSLSAKVGDKTGFIMELTYNAVAELNPQVVPQEHAHPMLLIEAPRQLFPFVRQIVAETTGNGGFPPLYMQMVDFAELYRRKFVAGGENQAEAAPAEVTPAPSVH
jgi:preprotein translocase subunit SecB